MALFCFVSDNCANQRSHEHSTSRDIPRERSLEELLFANRFGNNAQHGMECLHFLRQMQIFPSAYVDDFKIAGRTASLAPMPLIDQVYLECT